MTDVAGYLNSKGLVLKRGTAGNVHTTCFFCEEAPDQRGRLYIKVADDGTNNPPGLYHCKRCQARGNLAALKRFFGDEPGQDELDAAVRAELFAAAAAYYHHEMRKYPEVLEYLQGPERGLTVEALVGHQIGYAAMDYGGEVAGAPRPARAPSLLYRHLRDLGYGAKDILATGLCVERNGAIADALAGMVTIPYHVAGTIVSVRGRAWPFTLADFEAWPYEPYEPFKGKYRTLPGDRSRLFNSDATWDTDEVFVCEGEFDAIVLEQQGLPAVGVPGATSWQDTWDGYFEQVKRAWLVFDRDQAGEKAATKLMERLGSKCRRVHLSEEGTKCDPTQWFITDGHTIEEFAGLLDEARRGGLLITVEEAIAEFRRYQGLPGLKFHWELFDQMISPGLQPSQLMILLAKTGCLTGDTRVDLRRDGVEFSVPIEHAYQEWSKRAGWRRHGPTYARCVDGETVTWGEVDDIWSSGVKHVYSLATWSGRTVRATASHPFLTPTGWRKLGDLEVGDSVLVADDATVRADRVVNIDFVGEAPTFDLAMKDEPHNYLADGCIVHNTGKTLFLLNMMHRMRMVPGQERLKVLFVSLEQTRGEWWDRARRIHRFYDLDASEREAEEWWRDNIMIIDRNRLTERDLRQAIEDYAYERGKPDLVCVDYIGYFARSFRGEAYLRTTDAVAALKGIAKEYRVPLIAPQQVSRVAQDGQEFSADAGRDSGAIEEYADFLLTMFVPDNLLFREESQKTGEVKFRIGKSRHGGRGVSLSMQFAPVSLTLVPAGDVLEARAKKEFAWYQANKDGWDQIVYRHLTGFEGKLDHVPGGFRPHSDEPTRTRYP